MKKIGRLLSVLIMTMMIAAPFMSFATEGDSFDAAGNASEVTAAEDETTEESPTEEREVLTEPSGEDSEAAAQNTDTPASDVQNANTEDKEDNKDKTDTSDDKKDKENLPDEPTEVTVVGSVEELSEESDAAYDNDAFFTIDAAKDDSADLATDEVSSDITNILSGDGSTPEKQSEIIDTLEDSGLYRAEESGKSEVDVTSKFAYQRLRLVAQKETEINAYGASKAVYFEDSYLLSYDSIEATSQAYDALVAEYGNDAVFIDLPMKLSADEKGWGTVYMRMDYQKKLSSNSGRVTVAVIDSGIEKSHPIFRGKTILAGYDFINNDNDPSDDNGHGTEVSGIIAESTPANVRILPVKAMDSRGEGSLESILSAVRYAEDNGADIINLSLGGYVDDTTDVQYYDGMLGRYKALIVCASGNENKNMDDAGVMEFPGELDSTVCVGSITSEKEHSSFSNYGQAVDFAAPGSSIKLAKLGGSYGYDSGTSFSSPYIASAAAIVKAGHTNYSKVQVFDYLKSISEDMGAKGKDVYFGNGCPIFPYNKNYTLSTGWTNNPTSTTAYFTWKMDRPLSKGDRIDINGYKTTPKDNGDGTYTIGLTHFDPSRQYKIPIKVIDKDGKTISNVIYHYRMPYYQLTAGWTRSTSPTTADFTWKMTHPLADGARIDINGYKTTPKNNGDGTYTVGLTHFDPSRQYKIPIKVIDKNGRTISNVIYHYRVQYYQLTAGWTSSTSPSAADFTWKMTHPLADGARIDINGYRTTPRDNGDGTYTIGLKNFDPGRQYKIPIKVIDKSGKTISNVIYHYRMPYYKLTKGWTSNPTPTTADFTWRMNHPLADDAKIDINGYRTTPRDNGDGTYTIGLKNFDPGRQYKIPIKVIDKNGRTISNVIYHYRVQYVRKEAS